ncbi:MAG: N-acetyltransferase family protein [Actinomycetes bacterium]
MTIATVAAGPEHVDALGALAVGEHQQARTGECLGPLTPRLQDLTGTVALRDGQVVGGWLAEPAGGAQAAPLVGVVGDLVALRAAYAAQAAAWVAAGHRTHTATVRAADRERHDALVDLGFGHEQAYAVLDLAAPSTDVAPAGAGVDVRPGSLDDLEDIVRLAPIIGRHQVASPVFARVGDDFFGQLAEAHRAELADPQAHYLVGRVDGAVVGFALWYDGEEAPFVPSPAIELAVAATAEAARGRGVGLALTRAAVTAARERQARYVAADWRTTNLLASRFWPARGFRVLGYRMSRTIDVG